MNQHADQLARDTSGHWHGGQPGAWSGWTIDTRSLKPGEVFVALRTAQRDGHEFVAVAARAGAAAALVAHPVEGVELPQLVVADPAAALGVAAAAHRQRFAEPVVGVTGSCGKTSTKDLLGHVLGGDLVHRTAGNLNNQLGVPLTLLGLRPQEHSAAVIEAGMNEPGEIAVLARWIDPDVAVVTMVGPVHLERLGSLAAIAREKAELVRGLRPGGFAVVPCSVLEWSDFAAERARLVVVDAAPAGMPIRAGADALARWRPQGADHWLLAWQDRASGSAGEAVLPRVSTGQLANAALALVTGSRLRRSPAEMAHALTRWKPDGIRGAWWEIDGRPWYVDCYNSSPVSLTDAAECFDAQCPDSAGPRVWIIGTLGELGRDAVALHEQAARALPVAAGDCVLLVGPGAHTDALERGLRAAGRQPGDLHRVSTAAELAGHVAASSGPVFLKGSRMHRLEQLLPADVTPDLTHAVVPR